MPTKSSPSTSPTVTDPEPQPLRRILLLEDNPADVALFRWTLDEHELPYAVEVFTDGDSAMDFAHREGEFKDAAAPDLILLDLNVPCYDGLQILGALRRNPYFDTTPVGIYSSSFDPRDRFRAMEMGANLYLIKPMNLEEMQKVASTVKNVLTHPFPYGLRGIDSSTT